MCFIAINTSNYKQLIKTIYQGVILGIIIVLSNYAFMIGMQVRIYIGIVASVEYLFSI